MAYRTQSMDTSIEAEQFQLTVLRRLGPQKRLETMRKLSRSQKKLAWNALKRAHPNLSERELQIKAVELWYGAEHARRLEIALKERGKWS